jgi:hypothetical protein
MISVTVDTAGTLAGLNTVQRNQVPFALSRAINDVALSSRRQLIALMPSRFRFRTGTRWIESGGPTHRGWFNVRLSGKTHLEAFVEATIDYLLLQEVGGIKTSHRGGMIAVPLGKLQLKKIPPQLRPKFLLGQDLQGLFRATSLQPRSRKKQLTSFGSAFLLKTGGKTFIVRNVASVAGAAGFPVTRHGRTMDFMYDLVPAVHILGRMRMVPTVRDVVAREFNAAFALRLREAMATAR